MTIETNGATDHQRALAVVTERLAADFAARAEQVAPVVADAYAGTEDARVQSFRVLLAERDARAVLRRHRLRGGGPQLRASA